MTDGDRPLNNDWVLGPEPLTLPQTNGHTNVESTDRGFLQDQASKKGHMTKDEVRVMLKTLFDMSDEDMLDVVWEEMEQIRKKKNEE